MKKVFCRRLPKVGQEVVFIVRGCLVHSPAQDPRNPCYGGTVRELNATHVRTDVTFGGDCRVGKEGRKTDMGPWDEDCWAVRYIEEG